MQAAGVITDLTCRVPTNVRHLRTRTKFSELLHRHGLVDRDEDHEATTSFALEEPCSPRRDP